MALPERYTPATHKPRAVYYPTSDGKPMAETDLHRDQMIDDILSLKFFFQNIPNVYVSGNNFIYHEEGNPKKCLSPDVYVVFGVGSQQRDIYKVWEEQGRTPDVVFELTSRKTRTVDQNIKLPLYQKVLKVPEIFYFDPTEDYLKPSRLKGFRRVGESYIEIQPIEGRLHSEQLGLDLVVQGERLRLYDPVKGEWLFSATEYAQRAQQEVRAREEAERRAQQEAQRAQQEAHGRRQAEQRADQEAQRAQEEARAREDAERRASSAEAELQRLREQLEAIRQKPGET